MAWLTHADLFKLLEAFDYPINRENLKQIKGFCMGFSIMWMLAGLCGEDKVFAQRESLLRNKINQIPELKHRINAAKNRIKAVKTNEELADLPHEVRILGDIEPFLDSVWFAQRFFHDYQDYFENFKTSDWFKVREEAINYLASKKLEKLGGAKEIGRVIAPFDEESLTKYLAYLADFFHDLPEIRFLISTSEHVTALRYSQKKQMWTYKEINTPFQKLNPEKAAGVILEDMGKQTSKPQSDGTCVFYIGIFATGNTAAKIQAKLREFKHPIIPEHLKNIKCDNGANLIEWAVECNCFPLLEQLSLSPTEVNKQATKGRTLLGIAAYYGYFEIVKKLLEAGADVNQADQYGLTPLVAAAERGHLQVVRLLVDNGVQFRDFLNNSKVVEALIHVFTEQGDYAKISFLLRQNNIDLATITDFVNCIDKTNQHPDIVKLIARHIQYNRLLQGEDELTGSKKLLHDYLQGGAFNRFLAFQWNHHHCALVEKVLNMKVDSVHEMLTIFYKNIEAQQNKGVKFNLQGDFIERLSFLAGRFDNNPDMFIKLLSQDAILTSAEPQPTFNNS